MLQSLPRNYTLFPWPEARSKHPSCRASQESWGCPSNLSDLRGIRGQKNECLCDPKQERQFGYSLANLWRDGKNSTSCTMQFLDFPLDCRHTDSDDLACRLGIFGTASWEPMFIGVAMRGRSSLYRGKSLDPSSPLAVPRDELRPGVRYSCGKGL